MRGSLERDISSLRALGPGGGQISRVVHVSTRADFCVFAEKYGFVQEGRTFLEKKNMVSCKRGMLDPYFPLFSVGLRYFGEVSWMFRGFGKVFVDILLLFRDCGHIPLFVY